MVTSGREKAASGDFAQAAKVQAAAAQTLERCLLERGETVSASDQKQIGELWQLAGEYSIRAGDIKGARRFLLESRHIFHVLRAAKVPTASLLDDIIADSHAVDVDLEEVKAKLGPCQQKADYLSEKAHLLERDTRVQSALALAMQAAVGLETCLQTERPKNMYSQRRLGELWSYAARLAITSGNPGLARVLLLRSRSALVPLSASATLGPAFQGEVRAELLSVESALGKAPHS